MSEPNADDGLMVDITHEYIHDPAKFESTARAHTLRHATSERTSTSDDASASAADVTSTASGGDAGHAQTDGAAQAEGAPQVGARAESISDDPKRQRVG